jgi:hypothetical protein
MHLARSWHRGALPISFEKRRNRGRESFLDRLGLDAIDRIAKCRDDLVLQPVA